MSRKATIGVGVLAVSVLALAVDRYNARRIHDEKMLKAEQFKREFDGHLTVGTPLRAVEEYLQSKPVELL